MDCFVHHCNWSTSHGAWKRGGGHEANSAEAGTGGPQCGGLVSPPWRLGPRGELRPAQITDGDHSFLLLGVRDLPYYTPAERLCLRGQKGGVSPHGKRCRLTLRPLGQNPSSRRDACARLDPEIQQMWTQDQAKQGAWRKETWKKRCIKVPQTSTRAGLSASLSVGLSTQTLPSCSTLPSVFAGVHFLKAGAPGPRHWPLVLAALVARMQHVLASAWLSSLAGNRNLASRRRRRGPWDQHPLAFAKELAWCHKHSISGAQICFVIGVTWRKDCSTLWSFKACTFWFLKIFLLPSFFPFPLPPFLSPPLFLLSYCT